MIQSQISKCLLLIFCLLSSIKTFSQKSLSIDFNTNIGNIKKLTSVNNGPLSVVSGTSELCYKQIGIEMIRTHDFHGPCDYYGYAKFYNPFDSTFNYSFQTSVDTSYNWASTDLKLAQITTPGFKPFFRLGISAPGAGNPALTPPPKDADNINFHTFAGICKRTAMHYTSSWDSGFTYTIPYWEVWNEPNNLGFWTGTAQDYYLMYKQVADSMKAFNPNLKIGGPGAAKNAFYGGGNYISLNQSYISNFFQYCQTNAVPLDFYSFHTYDRKNPYHIKQLADTISYFLNQYGFNNTELIVSETNVNTGGFVNTGKGCAHLASTLISASDSRISKILWYRGVDLQPLCNSDIGAVASLQLQGYAYQFFNELYDSTSTRLATSGNEFVLNNINDSLNNLMLIAGKNVSNDAVKIMVSNYESAYQTIDLNISNLPWSITDQIKIDIENVTDSGLVISSSYTTGSTAMTVHLTGVVDASTYLITLRKKSSLHVPNSIPGIQFTVSPNPSNSIFNIQTDLANYKIALSNIQGQQIFSENNCKQFDVSSYASGVYFLTLTTSTGRVYTQKIVVGSE